MQVRMKAQISGMRNGRPWPGPGRTVELPDAEARDLIATGMAEPADGPGAVETAAAGEHGVQTAATTDRPSGRRAMTKKTAGQTTPDAAQGDTAAAENAADGSNDPARGGSTAKTGK